MTTVVCRLGLRFVLVLLCIPAWARGDVGEVVTVHTWSAGACCDSIGVCSITTQEACNAEGGEWLGEGTGCLPDPCSEVGACCLLDGSCRDVTEHYCGVIGGLWMGWGGTLCESGVCWGTETGYCCVQSLCFEVNEIQCTILGGDFTASSMPNPCAFNPCQMGACCLPDDTCSVTRQDQCSGEFASGLDCDPNPCVGACCLPNGTCTITTNWIECESSGGQWRGEGTTCSPNPCVGSDAQEPAAAAGGIVFSPAVPNPSDGAIECSITLRSAAAVRVRIYDLGGRALGRLLERDLDAGRHSFRWDPRSIGIPSGVYSLRYEARILDGSGEGARGEGDRSLIHVQRLVLLR